MTNWLAWLQGNPSQASNLAAINDAASQNNQSPALLAQVIGDESSYNPTASNPGSSALGLGQVLSGTASNPGYGIAPLADRTDPITSIYFTSNYLAATGGQGYATASAAETESGSTQTGINNVASPSSGIVAYKAGDIVAPASPGIQFDPGSGIGIAPDGSIVDPNGGTVITPNNQVTSPVGTAVTNLPGNLASFISAYFVRITIVVVGAGLLFVAAMMFNSDDLSVNLPGKG